MRLAKPRDPANRREFMNVVHTLKYNGEFAGSPWDLEQIAKMVALHRRQPAHEGPGAELRKAAELLHETHPELSYAIIDAALAIHGHAPPPPQDDPDLVADIDPVAHYVYTIWADRVAMYVGMSGSIVQRLATHAQTQPWWPMVTRVQLEGPYPTRASAYQAETERIQRMRPEHNKLIISAASPNAYVNPRETGEHASSRRPTPREYAEALARRRQDDERHPA